MDEAKIGQTVYIGAEPKGSAHSSLLQSSNDPLILIGGGIGIAPIMSIVKYLDYRTESLLQGRKIDIIHQTAHPSEFIFWRELVDFSTRHDSVNTSFLLSAPPTPSLLDELEPQLSKRLKFGVVNRTLLAAAKCLTPQHRVAIWGPSGFVNSTRACVIHIEQGLESRIYTDFY